MEICRAFELFEFIMAIIFAVILIVCVIALIILIPQGISAGSFKSKKTWIKYAFSFIGGGLIGTIIAFTYNYIKSMFC